MMQRMQDQSFLMNSDGPTQTMQVFSAAKVIWVDGKPQELNATSYNMVGNFQPMGGDDLMLVPEAQRTKDNIIVFTEQNEKTPKLNDHIVVDGKRYQIQNVENWGSYSKLRAMREDVGINAATC